MGEIYLSKPNPKKVAQAYLQGVEPSRVKTAGEVIFRKDRGGDKNEWAWGGINPSKREFGPGFKFDPKNLKPLAQTLRATLMALGHIVSANTTFLKLKSSAISPDGNLGGRGYIMKVTDMRRQFMNVSEALSALSDTLYDELKAPHWSPAMKAAPENGRERDGIREIMDDVKEIREDPEDWAQKEEAEGVDS